MNSTCSNALKKARLVLSNRVARLQYAYLDSPEIILFFGCGIGDDLLCTTIFHELRRRGVQKTMMFTKYPELFERSPDVWKTRNWNGDAVSRLTYWGFPAHVPHYGFGVGDMVHMPDEHILLEMCKKVGVTGDVMLRPYLFLAEEELKGGRLFPRQAVIHSAGLGKMRNKDWFPERFQKVCDQLQGIVDFIQLGLPQDPPLSGVRDLRGKTTFREAAAILANSHVFVGLVGFLMHLARAVNCRSAIVYGGSESPLITGYTCNENIGGIRPCSPCWQHNLCDYNHECMRMIQEKEVVNAVLRQLERYGEPLQEDIARIGS